MNDKIKKELLKWYKNEKNHTGQSIETFVDLIINRTLDALIDEVKTVLKKEFEDDTLKHNHVVSSDYYLELKLKEAKQNFFKS